MARTAPVPNFPAIPGMNPGLFVLGGGGDGGGSGAGRGKGKGGKQGAGGKNGGKDAKGDGRSACGGKGSCVPTHPRSRARPSRGDPVDALTGGMFTVPADDVSLPGPYPLVISRLYSIDLRDRDVGLGPGWAHSLASTAVRTRRMVRIYQGSGGLLWFHLPEVGGSSGAEGGYRLCRVEEDVFELLDAQGRREVFGAPSGDGTLRLTRMLDRFGNAITLTYEGDRLAQIVDSAGRAVAVRRDERGKVRAFEVKNALEQGRWVPFCQ
jgi:hypothetical protein